MEKYYIFKYYSQSKCCNECIIKKKKDHIQKNLHNEKL